jgi:RNA polymerase sigma factor (sigma-70 family)
MKSCNPSTARNGIPTAGRHAPGRRPEDQLTPAATRRQQVVDAYCRTRTRQAADAVVVAYWPLLRQWTGPYWTDGCAFEDILQTAACGFVKAMARFDPERAGFDTYARHCVVGEVRHYLRDHAGVIRVPRSMWQRGEGPMVRSLNMLLDETESGRPPHQIGSDDAGVARADDRAQLWDLLRHLNPRQGAALLLWVGFQLPQETVAVVLGVPQTSVCRLCQRALRTLRLRAGAMEVNRQ